MEDIVFSLGLKLFISDNSIYFLEFRSGLNAQVTFVEKAQTK